jgi:hypothetical protein
MQALSEHIKKWSFCIHTTTILTSEQSILTQVLPRQWGHVCELHLQLVHQRKTGAHCHLALLEPPSARSMFTSIFSSSTRSRPHRNMSRKEVSVHQGKRHNLLSPHASTQDQICYRKNKFTKPKREKQSYKSEHWGLVKLKIGCTSWKYIKKARLSLFLFVASVIHER